MERISTAWQAFLTWFGTGSSSARVTLATLALILGCGCCSLGYAVGASGSSNSSTNRLAADSTQVTQPTDTLAPPTNTPKPKSWVTVKHLSGSGNSQSDTFSVQTGDHVVSSCTTNSDANLFIADFYRQGETSGNNLPYASLVDRSNAACTKDTYTIQQENATVYLSVQADGIQWTVDVQRFE